MCFITNLIFFPVWARKHIHCSSRIFYRTLVENSFVSERNLNRKTQLGKSFLKLALTILKNKVTHENVNILWDSLNGFVGTRGSIEKLLSNLPNVGAKLSHIERDIGLVRKSQVSGKR